MSVDREMREHIDPTPAEVLAFLNGTGPLEGRYFGDAPVFRPYWWRRYLHVFEPDKVRLELSADTTGLRARLAELTGETRVRFVQLCGYQGCTNAAGPLGEQCELHRWDTRPTPIVWPDGVPRPGAPLDYAPEPLLMADVDRPPRAWPFLVLLLAIIGLGAWGHA